ncbi:MAG TPA: two-component regulator propeller domain-containing protein [Ohtaekwangia sp.]
MKSLLASWLLLGCTCLWAQTPEFRFDHLTLKDGLSQSQAYCMYQDSHGYLWVGTQDGLNRYDGHTFRVFKNDPFDSATLSHNWIWSIAEDLHGDLWIGTFQGLCKYVRAEDKFIQYYHVMHDSTSISGDRPNNIIRDKKGRLWISSWGNGLNLYDEKTNSFQRFLNKPNELYSLSDNAIRTLFCDRSGTIWIGTWNGGLNRVIEDEKGIRFQRYNNPEGEGFIGGNRITSIAEDKTGNLWIGSYESGLMRYDKIRNEFNRVPNFFPDDVNKVFCDSKGDLWIGTNHGLHYFNTRSQQVSTYYHQPSNPYSLSSNTIYAVYEDRSGIVWISANGLDKYDPHKNLFQLYRKTPDTKHSMEENHIYTFCEDDERNIWIGSEDGPISVFNPQSKTFRSVTISDTRGNVATNIQRIIFDGRFFWIATFNSGLVRYEKKSGKPKFFLGVHPSALGTQAFIKEVLMDYDSSLWIGTYDNGLLHYDPKTETVQQFKVDRNDRETSIGSNFINALYLDQKNTLWIGHWGGGLSKLDRSQMKFKNYVYDQKDKSGLSDQSVSSITQHDDSIYWICTHAGLNKLNVNTGRFTHFFEKDGLANNFTYEMLQDADGYYWISTNGGLSRFNPKTLAFKNYNESDGLQSTEFNSNAALKMSSGEFLFGGINGFNLFNPKTIPDNTSAPAVVIHSYSVFDNLFTPREAITLPYNENYITIAFSALEFSAPDKIKYSYKLEGFEKEWSEPDSKREAHYTNLDPGHYTFRVKASNPDGYWTESGPSMIIVIEPPFWKTWWFISLVVLVSAAIAYAVHRYRLEQSLKVERLRNKIASDLHDEVGSSLTRISIYSDLLQNGTNETEGKGYLKGISDLSREVVLTMSDIVWSIDNRYDTMEALILRMKDFATEMLQAKNIELDFKVDGVDLKKELDPVTKQNLYLIFKEAINNIVKHSGARHVRAELTSTGNTFKMLIQDNGKGVPSGTSAKGNGLRNMTRRAKAISGELEIRNVEGTTILLTRQNL